MDFKTLIFDMGNVLVSFCNEKRLKQISNITGLNIITLKELLFKTELAKRYEKGEVSSWELYRILSKESNKLFSYSELTQANCNIFTARPEMTILLKKLKEQGYRLLLLSNTSQDHFDYIAKNFDFLNLFDDHVLSYQVGYLKPEKEIYEIALIHAKSPASFCFYVDDIPEYIEAAKTLGIEGHIYTSFSSLLETLQRRKILKASLDNDLELFYS